MTRPAADRRDFFRTTALAAGGLLSAGSARAASPAAQEAPAANSVLLFQGDSITDAGRDRKRTQANDARGLGDGYPLLIAAELLKRHPELKLSIHNRGVSGNKVPDLDARWEQDCLALKPDVLSILIGVNDIWHKLNGRYDGDVARYGKGLRDLLARTREALPQTRLIVCEPFVLRCGAVNDSWFPEFDDRRRACRAAAEELQCEWVPFQSMFDEAVSEQAPPSYWAGDGVHPSLAGHALMAKTWLAAVFG